MIFATHKTCATDTVAGFTLLETLVAVSLLMMAIIGPLTIAQKSVKTATYTKNRTTAYYLAQDALEYLRNVRDTGSLRGLTWNDVVTAYAPCIVGFGTGKCDVGTFSSPAAVFDTPQILSCPASPGTCAALVYVEATGYFGHLRGAPLSQFRREISITQMNTHELLIRVDVIWNEGILGGEKKISLYDEVYDWQ